MPAGVEHSRPRRTTSFLPFAPTPADCYQACEWCGTLNLIELAMRMLSWPPLSDDNKIEAMPFAPK